MKAQESRETESKAEAKRQGSNQVETQRFFKQQRVNTNFVQKTVPKKTFLNKKNLNYSYAQHLRIFFLNIQGNVSHKLPIVMNTFSSTHDIIILAETWHEYTFNSISPDWVVAHSDKRGKDLTPRVTGRNHGGLLFLLRPSLKHLISQIEVTTYTITVKFKDITVMGLYLPPTSLTLDEIKTLFETVVKIDPDIMVGDYNFDPLGKKPESTVLKERKAYLCEKLSSKYNAHFIKPLNGELPNDHVFSRRGLDVQPRIELNVPIRTDHKHALSVEVQFDTTQCDRTVNDIVRFCLSRLQSEDITASLQRQYISRVPPMWLLNDVKVYHNNYIDLIETSNTYLVKNITASCDQVIGRKKTSIGSSVNVKPENREISEIAKDFKRDQKQRNNFILQSRSDSLSVIEDVTQYFCEIFQQDEISHERHVLRQSNSLPTEDMQTILPYFSESSVESILMSYSNTKSCGKDGIHVLILKQLISKGICSHLSRIFHLCLKYGYTPKAWNETITMPIPKANPKGGTITIDDCRPIGLTCMFRRIFESCLVNAMTLKNSLSDKVLTNYGQGGFKRD
ncbi:hypothetical protein MP638_002220, partial [Amoeboaphelidium occidentale]